jgi:two-component system chemotaxis response regulator CheV
VADSDRRNDHSHDGDRLELLLFNLGTAQRFGINVLKVKEVIPCPHLTQVPHAHPAVRGVAHLRGEPLTVIDLSAAIGRVPLVQGDEPSSVIVTEFNRAMQGFLVRQVHRIAVCDWKQVLPPPKAAGVGSYTTGVTRIEDELIQILDVEKVLGEVIALEDVSDVDVGDVNHVAGKRVMVVDDSSVARNQTVRTLDQIGVAYLTARDGREALELLRTMGDEDSDEPVQMVISDIEMPEMDGYTLTRELRQDPVWSGVYVLLHTSLNGAINAEKADKVGANAVLTKFVPDELAKAVVAGLEHE